MMTDQSAQLSDDGRKMLMQAVAVVFGGTVAGLHTEDAARETEIVRELWPAALDLSGYEIAKECILALAATAHVDNDTLAGIATAALQAANPTL